VVALYLLFFKDVLSFNVVRYFENDSYLAIRIIFGLLLYSSILIYTVLTFVKLREFRRQLGTEYSYNSGRLRLNWLNFIALLFSLIFTSYMIIGGINALSFSQVIDLESFSHIGLTILAYAVSYFGLKQTMLFKARFARPKIADSIDGNNGVKDRFTTEEVKSLKDQLQDHMVEKMPYLNPELTLSELSSDLNISKYDLTFLLNNHIGKNFFSYVNEFRLKQVIEKLKNPDYNHLTIISIAFDSGFNSKSTFNSLFKQHTGRTPSEYKKFAEIAPSTN